MTDDASASRRVWLAVGRGRGWLGARQAGDGCLDTVMGLILDDPRVDRQIEERASYYATLLLPLDPDLAAISLRALEPCARESDAWLAVEVLGELARRGHSGALETLHSARTGPHAERVSHQLIALAPLSPSPAPRSPASRPSLEVGDPHARLEEIERALRQEARAVAAGALVRRLGGGRERRGWLRLLEALPPELTLPRARVWLDEPWPLSLAAESVLSDHATESDRPTVEARLAAAHGACSYYRLCSLIDALATIGHVASVPLLCTVHDEVAYSYARGRALRALSVHPDHPAVRERMREGLWDCDAVNRDIAADTCDASDPDVRVRLLELADDPHEPEFVRETAALALREGVRADRSDNLQR